MQCCTHVYITLSLEENKTFIACTSRGMETMLKDCFIIVKHVNDINETGRRFPDFLIIKQQQLWLL